jgi:hypothetical protein
LNELILIQVASGRRKARKQLDEKRLQEVKEAAVNLRKLDEYFGANFQFRPKEVLLLMELPNFTPTEPELPQNRHHLSGVKMVDRGWSAGWWSNEIISNPVCQAPDFPPFDSRENARASKRQKVNGVTLFDIPLRL